MNELFLLVKRNLKNYLRDRLAVFFSLLSSIIILLLFFVFIKKSFMREIPSFVDDHLGQALVIAQLIGGTITLSIFSLSLGALGVMVDDFADKKMTGLLVSRTSKLKLGIGYIIASWFIAFAVSAVLSGVLFLYAGISTTLWFSGWTYLIYYGLLLLFSVLASIMMFCLVSVIKSSSAYGAINGILGTLFGFLCGIYMPYSIIGEAAQTIGSLVLPTQASVALKSLLLNDLFATNPVAQEAKDAILHHFGGEEIGLVTLDIGLPWILLIEGAIVIGLFLLSIRHLKKRFY